MMRLSHSPEREDSISPDLSMTGNQDDKGHAVVVRNAYKRYTKQQTILDGLDLTLPKNKIYGLLGPSGCGKTTLLSCIVGRMRLDYGSIKLSATTRRELGYMPQDLNLHLRLSIWETLKFYGYLFGMEIDEIRKRADELIKFLHGGQQRRTSLAVALLHNPDLLILDEPTVGLDPVLSKSIWDRLVEMTENGKTVMITTHYIEEARQAHIIGLMREGVLLAEESPASLMARRNVDSLETAFLQLSQLQEHNSKKAIEPKAYPIGPRPPVTLADNTWFLPSRFKAQVMKNLYLLKREHIFVAFVFLLPIVQMTLFNTAIGQDPKNLPFGVVSYDTPNGFADCRPDAYHGCLLDSSYNYSITCKYREHLLKKDFAVKEFRSLEEARSNVWHNNIWGVIFFNQNFTKALGERIDKRNRLDDETLEMSIMDAWIDLSNQYIGNMVKHSVTLGTIDFVHDVLKDCNITQKLFDTPLTYETPVYGSMIPKFTHFASVAMLALCAFYLPTILTASLMITEKMGGLIERIMVAGVTFSEMTGSMLVVQFVVMLIQNILSLIVMYGFFDNPMIGNYATVFIVLNLLGFGGMFFGILIGVGCNTYYMAAYVGTASNLMLVFICGLAWPVEGAHYLLKSVSWMFPLTLTTQGLRGMTARGWPLMHPTVLEGVASIVVWIGLFVLICIVLIKTEKGSWVSAK
ncbi:hypothetical protein M8J76_016648 [Diaphorina citri]|nr:hypothetical protein M8J76_016648 [Diaphorina citri]